MRKIVVLFIISFIYLGAYSQDFSNKGRDFWVGYGYHAVMTNSGNSQDMLLYFATDQPTTITVTIPGLGWTRTYTSGAGNSIITSDAMPKNTPDARLVNESTSGEDKGIHITADHPVVAYAHILNGSASGATVLYPTNTLGKEYYSVNYTNNTNGGDANCWFYVIATDPGTTTVEITPSAQTINHPAGVPFTVNLTQGQIFNCKGIFTNISASLGMGVDLTGSKIKSISSGTGDCKRIAVFSGSGRIAISCNTTYPSSDNYMVQALPKSAWGKNFLTSPTAAYGTTTSPITAFANNIYRVCVSDPSTNVYIDGVLTALPLQGGFYYEIPGSSPTGNIKHSITADQPITVAQYLTSQNACGNASGDGDPEVIYLSPIEQSINTVTWNACTRAAINSSKHYINVIIPNGGTAISSFRLDGSAVSATNFTVHPRNANYSTATLKVSGTTTGSGISHTIASDSGFNAIAYGYGPTESYGYNAGTNVRDLNQKLEVTTPNGIETSPSVCIGASTQFKVYFPVPNTPTSNFDSLHWSINTTNVSPNNFPFSIINPTIDSTNMRNGKSVNWYSLPASYSFSTPGVYTVTITTYKSSNEGCGSAQDFDFPIEVSAPPTTDFLWFNPGCPGEPATFQDQTITTKPTYKYVWDFADPTSPNNTSDQKNPSHIFTGPGTYKVAYYNITTPGCVSNPVFHDVIVPDYPKAAITGTLTVCQNAPSPPVIITGTLGKAPYEFEYDINGGSPITVTSDATGIYVINNVPTNTVGPVVITLHSVKNAGSAVCTRVITGQAVTVTVSPYVSMSLTSLPATANQTVCVNAPIDNILYSVTTGGTGVTVVGSLPPGITGTFSGGVYTLLGTPTIPNVYSFKLRPAGICPDPTFVDLDVTLTVTANATLTLQTGTPNQMKCVNLPIDDIKYIVAGGASNATVTFLPIMPGVTGTYDNTSHLVSIIGTPTVAGVYTFTVNTVSTCVNAPPQSGTLTILPDATVALTSAAATTAQTLCLNGTAIAPITYDIIDGAVSSVTVSPLPAGVTYTYVPGSLAPFVMGKLTISGTPTAATPGNLAYTVNVTGFCKVPTPALTGTINVQPDATISLQSGSNTQTVCINAAIGTITYKVQGAVTAVNVTGLPAGVTYTYTPGNVSTNTPGSISIQGTPPASFTYSITLTGPCQVPAAIGGTITVTPDATLTLNSSAGSLNQTVCVGKPIVDIQYTIGGSATGGGFTFTPGPGLPPGLTLSVAGNVYKISGSPTVVSSTPVNYSFSFGTAGPCVNQQGTGTITVNPNHTLVLSTGAGNGSPNQTVCVGTPIVPIRYVYGGGANGMTYVSGPPGIVVTLKGPDSIIVSGTPTASGTYVVQTFGGNSCQVAQVTGIITATPLPTAAFSFTTPSCNTRTITFTDNSVPNAGTITNWAWNFDDPASGSNTSTLQNPAHVFSTARTYNVTLTVTNSNGCINAIPFSKPVVINERPHTDFNVPTLACVSDIASFTDISTFGTGTADLAAYKWIFDYPTTNPANIQLSKNGTHQFPVGGTYTVMHIAGSLAGCLDTITHTITIASAATADFSVGGAAALCVNDSVAITNLSTITVGNINKLEIYWDYLNAPTVADIDNAPALNKIYKHKYLNFQTPGNKPYTIMVRAFSGITCTNDKQRIITINAVPKVQFNAMPDVCYTALPFQITQASEVGGVAGTGGYTGPGVSPTGMFNPVTAGIGTHKIKYTFTSLAGCIDTMSNTITVLDTATVNFSYATPICNGTAVSFKDESTAPAGVTLGGIIANFGDGSPQQPYLPGSTFNHTYATWGSYTVTLYNTSTYGCKSRTASQVIYVNPIPQPAFTINETSVCLPAASVSFANTSSIADNSALTYDWDFGDPLNPTHSSAKTPPPHVYTGVGPYTVTLKVTGAVGTGGSCNLSTFKLVNFIHPQPKAAFTFSKPGVCIGDNVIVTDRTNGLDGSVQQWFWDFGDNSKGSANQILHTYTTPQTYSVSLYIVNSQGCNSDTLTQPFAVHPYPVVDAGPDRIVLEGGSVTMAPIVTGNDLQYLWSPATYLNSTTTATPTANIILNDITYTLTVTGRGGCTAPSDKMFIKVLKAPKVANTFTPNGDGINDLWLIDYLDTYPDCKVQVFTRSGQVVFESKGYKTPWNGTIKGKPLPFDTYYYIIEPGNGRAPISGYVTIVK